MKPSPRFTAIDIGSNAVRLLFSSVFENNGQPVFKKISLIRMPLRLGDDVFTRQRIPERKIQKLIQTMKGFSSLIDAYDPVAFRGCATSAMREAENGAEVCRRIKNYTGLDIDIITGKQEAELIFANKSAETLTGMKAFLYVDVGGGSTEITLFSEGQALSTESFNIGTIRLMEDMVAQRNWKQMKKWITRVTAPYESIAAIGTGGNINKLSKMAYCKKGQLISYEKLRKARKRLKDYTFDERVTVLGLKPDRADVIIPASQIYLNIMKWGSIKKIYVPVVGLADGLVRMMYNEYLEAPLMADDQPADQRQDHDHERHLSN